ncbi:MULTISPECIES: aconitate hydratase AcnA [Paraburkholderia]|uniref:aconitate hydratase AcnA n=1 Tax=Paraburkholderia TaxID=1822464 RepID=UPI00224CFB1A|nr:MULTISPECIES: aconitate hydratase AcnA [Paraburkholderia]MCX4163167.1 aconitate hydratase AcnA [Paraburkholderia megapolitana]MDN7158663.1 aconitate hydratase AcnA [Paraburkholderia sp. CHISQ3]MDQ6495710.1 aconitate hydratase AcnA [Paraburkholderia megapolitana]
MPRTLPAHAIDFVSVRDATGAIDVAQFAKMPYSVRVFAENIVRKHPTAASFAYLQALAHRRHDVDFPYYPARVVLQDLLGTPALVDLAGMRDAVAEAGGDPSAINPVVPTHLVVDHSLNVEVAGTDPEAMAKNMAIEQDKNAERFEFLAWCKQAFTNLDVLMPGNGILHQVNLEHLSPVIQVKDGVAFPDTLVGTDSHTTMINALGVLGWGVGGIEAESVMLGRAVWLRLPTIVGVELKGFRQSGVTATDLVLAITEFLRKQNVVGTIIEFYGEGARAMTLSDRATISNMAPEFGATAALFAIDQKTLDFLRLTGRSEAQISLTEAYARAQGLWADDFADVEYDRVLSFDLSSAGRALAGPANPHDRVPLSSLIAKGIARPSKAAVPEAKTGDGAPFKLEEGAVVIAAITSCTNTSNPRNMIAAGLVARKAVELGLERKPWVKTSLAPGSKPVERYLRAANLMTPLETLGFGIIGFGCTSCNGMSGPLPREIEADIVSRDVRAVAVLSGNRNFNGRIHPRVKEAFLASPPLVVAYAIAGTIHVDIEEGALGTDKSGAPVYLKDLWPSDEEIDALLKESIGGDQYLEIYTEMFRKSELVEGQSEVPAQFPWRDDSNYIRRPPYWQSELTSAARFADMRAIGIFGDNVTTDDLSPSGAILPESAAGEYLIQHGVQPAEFNSYGTRRGDHRVAIRATFANNRLHNEMAGGKEGSFTRIEPEGTIMRLFDAAEFYVARGQELIVVAGKNYGSGSSRDWAAKGVRLIGVRAVVCENFERIHRSNLVGMGVLPLEFTAGHDRLTLALDGSEVYAVEGVEGNVSPGALLTLRITRKNGEVVTARVKCRIDTEEEAEIFNAGGLLPRISGEMLEAAST